MSKGARTPLNVVIGLLVVALALAGCAKPGGKDTKNAQGLTKVTYIQATQNLSYLPIFVAMAAGYFKEQGLEIDRKPNLANAVQLSQMAAAGQVDIAGVGSSGVYSLAASGRPVRSFAALCKAQVFQLALSKSAIGKLAAKGTTPASPIAQRVQALKGLTLGVTPAGTLTDVLMRSTLAAYGVRSDKDVTLEPLKDDTAMLAAARQGKIDGFLFPPPSSLSLAQDGGGVWIDYAKGDVPVFTGAYQLDLVASTSYLDKNQDTVKKFLTAVWKAVELIKSSEAEVEKLVKPTYPDLDAALYSQSVKAVAPAFGDGINPTQDGFNKTLALTNKTLAKPLSLTYGQIYQPDLAQATKP